MAQLPLQNKPLKNLTIVEQGYEREMVSKAHGSGSARGSGDENLMTIGTLERGWVAISSDHVV